MDAHAAAFWLFPPPPLILSKRPTRGGRARRFHPYPGSDQNRHGPGVVSGWPKSDWYHLRLPATSLTPMIVHVRFVAFPLSP
jgi:hypothetical protein